MWGMGIFSLAEKLLAFEEEFFIELVNQLVRLFVCYNETRKASGYLRKVTKIRPFSALFSFLRHSSRFIWYSATWVLSFCSASFFPQQYNERPIQNSLTNIVQTAHNQAVNSLAVIGRLELGILRATETFFYPREIKKITGRIRVTTLKGTMNMIATACWLCGDLLSAAVVSLGTRLNTDNRLSYCRN